MTDLRSAYGLMSDDFSPYGDANQGNQGNQNDIYPQNFGHGQPPAPPALQSIQDSLPQKGLNMPPPLAPQISPSQPLQGQGQSMSSQSTFLRPPTQQSQQQNQIRQSMQSMQSVAQTVPAMNMNMNMPMVPMVPAIPVQVQSGYMDALVSKKKDMARLVLMGLVILFAISAHSVIDFSMRNFIVDLGMTFRQEIGLRLLYPALVILVLWHLRAFSIGKSRI